jgi:hypothetical protein
MVDYSFLCLLLNATEVRAGGHRACFFVFAVGVWLRFKSVPILLGRIPWEAL